ncbi:MAG: type II secretion system protein GspN [Deltaproteobacteria bacterium]|nr:MAG: type II secretion system protein GspN [Deltaproteobacteria bacterium]
MKRKVLHTIGYVLFFLVSFAFFLVRGFPVHMVAKQLDYRAKAAGLDLNYATLKTSFPSGIVVEALRITKPIQKEQETIPLSVRIDRGKLDFSLLGLLGGKKHIDVDLELLGGRIDGSVESKDSSLKLDLRLSSLRLERLMPWDKLIGQQLVGQLSGALNVDWNLLKARDSTGEISLELASGKVGKGKIYGVELPMVDLGKTLLQMNISKAKLECRNCKVESDEVDAALEGYLLLQKNILDTSAHLRLRAKPSEAVIQKVKNKLPPEFHTLFDQKLAQSRGRDGWFRYSIYGRIFKGAVSFRPLRQ